MSKTLLGIGILTAALMTSLDAQQEDDVTRKVTGTVLEAANQRPVANATVEYEESGQMPRTTVTDARGQFEFPPGGLGVITVTARNFGTARGRWPPTSAALRFELVPPGTVRGAVRDLATGRLLDAVVTVLVENPGNFVSASAMAQTGAFEVEDLPPGPALVMAQSAGYAPFVGSTTVEDGQSREFRVGLLLEAQASGVVQDAEGDPAAGATVTATYVELAHAGLVEGFMTGQFVTGADGLFGIGGLVPDTPIALQAELNGRRSPVTRIQAGPGMRRVDIVLSLP